MTAWSLGSGAVDYQRLMAQGSWTAATTTIGFVPVGAIILALLGYGAGRTFLNARAAQGPWIPRLALPIILAGATVYLVATDIKSDFQAARAQHAADSTLSSEAVAALVQRIRSGEADKDDVGAFLGNPLFPPELLAEYAASADPSLRIAVARNQKIDATLAEKLATDADDEARCFISFERDLAPTVLARLAADAREHVREMVAWTKALPDEDFEKLTRDPSAKVRAAAARQPRISEETLERLRNDPEERVRPIARRDNRAAS